METKKALTTDQLNQLKETVRQRFDELYQRIGKNRANLSTKVLTIDQSINKELSKEKIDTDHEKDILRKVREIEREANNQLPHIPKAVAPVSSTPAPAKPVKSEKAETKPKPKTAAKPEKTASKSKEKGAGAKAKKK
ncbi:hypothetical protein WSM22_10130 [Cytophagales bacterium WSM2-2]|nr:hypothetical protein WSM22_10130 [Cytophagales bacterium WSM2-2]